MLLHSLHRRFQSHAWATATLAAALPGAPAAAVRPLAHAVTADRVWLLRLYGEPTEGVALWPDLPAAGVAALARQNADAMAAWFDGLGALGRDQQQEALARTVAYTTSAGVRYQTATEDILDHVLLHGAHHRGQVCAALREATIAPPAVDFIVWQRLGEPAPPA